MTELLDQIPDVEIDDNGVFKYILIRIYDDETEAEKTVVRGFAREYHADIYDEVQPKILQGKTPRLETLCLGGGFIEHNSAEKNIEIFGRSIGFGKADHTVTLELLKKAFPECHIEITYKE